jgi:hypothetical protein
MHLQMEFTADTAVKIAEYFEKSGYIAEANRLWMEINHISAYNRDLRAKLGDFIFKSRENQFEPGTVLRSRFILQLMSISYPTRTMVGAYFENLRQLLRGRAKLSQPGNVILGLGTGRCGSTTLSAAFGGVPDACATHENPPHIFWEPAEEQVCFHLDRMRMLADYFPLVFDAAHWWLNACPRVLTEFPRSKLIGLVRETETCVQSWLKFQGRGWGSKNNWAPPENGVWRTVQWDPTFPAYPMPADIRRDTDDEEYKSKKMMITRYVTEYNRSLGEMAVAQPKRVMLIRTEALNEPITATRLRAFVGADVTMPARSFNVGNNQEGIQPEFWY